MHFPTVHSWDLSPTDAIALQKELASRVRLPRPRRKRWQLIAGADAAMSKRLGKLVAGIVLMRMPEGEVVEERLVVSQLEFPYVPGLLSFREGPGLIEAFRRLRHKPHVVICDGQGIAHPRGLGLASHLGLWLGVPTIGSAKSRLIGEHREPGRRRGSRVPLEHDGEVVGSVLRTRDGVKPLWVSPGHRIDIETAADVVFSATTRYRLPEPQRLADQLVGRERRRLEGR